MFSKIAISLISPLGTALALGCLALAAAACGLRRTAWSMGAMAVVWLGLWSTPAASVWLRGEVERDYPAVTASMLPDASAAVVLGGALSPPREAGGRPDLGAAADRVWFAAALYHAGKAPLLLLSGSSDRTVSSTSEADAMRLLLRDLGVPEVAMVVEDRSWNTEENAQFSAAILRERGIRKVLLVTSALHMQRAVQLFHKQGLDVIPAPTDHEARPAPAGRRWIPDAGALEGSARAMKEIVARSVSR